MNLKKTWFTSMAAITLASVGAAVTSANYHGDGVFASTTPRKLKHNAIIYTKNGKCTKKAHLKKGKKVTIHSYKTIKGKKFAYIGKGQYILVSNLSGSKKKATKKTTKPVKKINPTKDTDTSEDTSDDEDPEDANVPAIYKQWLKDRKKGNLVAIRDSVAVNDYGDTGDHYSKGELVQLSEDMYFDHGPAGYVMVEALGGDGYFRMINPADFEFKTYDNTYKDKLATIKRYTKTRTETNGSDVYKYTGISIIPTVSIKSHQEDDRDVQTLTAGKRVTLHDPKLLINDKGEYVVSLIDDDSYEYQIPYNQITGWKKPKTVSTYYPES